MNGTFCGIGTGPGDASLLTLKAAEKIRSADAVILPNREKEKCVAYQIAIKAVPELEQKELVFCDFPMTKDPAVLEEARQNCGNRILELVHSGKNVVFLTIGDPAVYSTFMYVHSYVEEQGIQPEIVSGVTSFCAAASALGISLSDKDQQLHILPASYDISRAFELSGTLIFMKSGKKLQELKEFLEKSRMDYDFDFYAASNVGMENQILCRSLDRFDEKSGYLTVVIIKNIVRKNQDGYKFFQNRSCKYFPCHKNIPEEDFNCLFCYCPLYFKGTECGGNFIIKENGVKSCVNCTFPHHRENYDAVNKKLK